MKAKAALGWDVHIGASARDPTPELLSYLLVYQSSCYSGPIALRITCSYGQKGTLSLTEGVDDCKALQQDDGNFVGKV